MGTRIWFGVGAYGKIAGKDSATFPDFRGIVYNGISKIVYDGQT